MNGAGAWCLTFQTRRTWKIGAGRGEGVWHGPREDCRRSASFSLPHRRRRRPSRAGISRAAARNHDRVRSRRYAPPTGRSHILVGRERRGAREETSHHAARAARLGSARPGAELTGRDLRQRRRAKSEAVFVGWRAIRRSSRLAQQVVQQGGLSGNRHRPDDVGRNWYRRHGKTSRRSLVAERADE